MSEVLVVGAGPSAVQAAHQLLARGLSVRMIDFGVTDRSDVSLPDPPPTFAEFRATAGEQSPILWGRDYGDFPFVARPGGAGLTPPRTFATAEVARWTPSRTDNFAPVESLAAGGLGEAWGLGAFVLAPRELEAMGLDAAGIQTSYRRVCQRIGVSGVDVPESLPPLDLDQAAESLWRRAGQSADRLGSLGIRARRTPLALLSQPYDGRGATPYSDMDFYANPGTSAYRPAFDVGRLTAHERFAYSGGHLAVRVRETPTGVEVDTIARADRRSHVFAGDAVVLCAGTLGTARLALRSGLVGASGSRLRLACSPYAQIVGVLPALVGRALRDRRHSMGQIVLQLEREDDWIPLASLLSYRSLLLTRLMREAPIPVRQARALFHLLQSGLVIAGVFIPQRLRDATTELWLEPDADSPTGDRLAIVDSDAGAAAAQRQRSAIDAFRRALRLLGVVPLRTVELPHGASIHYGGTLPFGTHVQASTGCLADCRRVFVGDGSPFHMVPGKGITLTLMAYADWVADRVADQATQ